MNSLQIATRDRMIQKYADGSYTTVEVPCLCGAAGGLIVAELDRFGLPSPSVVCRACGVVRTSPRLSDDSLAAFYSNEYQPLYTGCLEASGSYLQVQGNRGMDISHFVEGLIPAGSRVVDFGCGAGWTLLPFHEAGHRVAGCDLGDTYLEAGRERGLDLRHGDHTTLADMAPFDLVILSHVFEHITDPKKLMEDIKPMLAPGALVYIEVPGLQTIQASHCDPMRYFQNAHLWSFDLGSLTAVMAGCGYRQVKGNEFVRSVFTPDETAIPMDQGGYERAVRALARAEATRHFYNGRRLAKDAARKMLGAERASKLKRSLSRSW
ncbi:class I SAM-dependent methyltransferase [Mycolicibacterium sp.]|uniref:class I SAM-dependent methyltransferase n=1 Tax=Mycolicibacterium sp. TaxID=2320850 RepID=UPI0025E74DCA|nr:class I SAM-dependent methyltransferase [Mycolicibacterium sp.]MCB9409865.1 class I SAM-dependent methyltransferase [Mycolicibacterium sp.]